MKSFRTIGTSLMLLLFGWGVPAGPSPQVQEKPKDQEKQPAKPADKPQKAPKPANQGQQPSAHQQDSQRKQQEASAKQADARNQQAKQQDSQRKQQEASAKQADARNRQAKQQDSQRSQQEASAKQADARNRQAKQQEASAKLNQEELKRGAAQRDRPDNPVLPQQQTQPRPDQQAQVRQPQERNSDSNRSPAQVKQQQIAWQGDRANRWQTEHRTWQERGGYRGYHVPDDRFRSFYGREHGFRIFTLPVVYVGGQRRFQYGGYWFGFVDPWPEYWADDWYDNDDVYVDYYEDGYYLHNRRYPGDRVAVTFFLN